MRKLAVPSTIALALVALATGPQRADQTRSGAEPASVTQAERLPVTLAVETPLSVVPSVPAEAPDASAPAAAGFRAFKDPKTGRLREAEQEEQRALARKGVRGRPAGKLRASDTGGEGLTVVEGVDGSIGIQLDDSFMTALVATIGADGKAKLQHVDGLKAAEAGVRNAAAKIEQGDRDDR